MRVQVSALPTRDIPTYALTALEPRFHNHEGQNSSPIGDQILIVNSSYATTTPSQCK